jgi:DNA-binding NarL/FixJ family response regulator
MNTSITILIVEGDEPLRRAIRSFLEATSDMVVVGETGDWLDAAHMAGAVRPDVILFDMQVFDGEEWAGVVETQKISPGSKMIALSSQSRQYQVLEAFRKGVQGYLDIEGSDLRQLVGAVRAVSRGEAVLTPQMAGWVLDEIVR